MLKHLSQKFSINLGVDFLWNNKISCTSPVNRLVTNTFRFPFCLQCRLYTLPHNVSEPSRTIRRPCDVIYLFKAKANSFQTFTLYKCIFLCKNTFQQSGRIRCVSLFYCQLPIAPAANHISPQVQFCSSHKFQFRPKLSHSDQKN